MLPVLIRVPDWIPLVGGEPVTSFGALLLIAFLVAGGLFVRKLRQRYPDAAGWDLVVTAAVAGLVGAKLMHLGVHTVLGQPSSLGRAGLDWLGGLAIASLAVLWHARREGLDTGAVAGAAAAPLALGYAIGRLGSFLVGADYGVPTGLPWGIAFPAGAPPTTPSNLAAEFGAVVPAQSLAGDFVRVHPTQLYEAALSLGVYGVLERLRWGRNESSMPGWRLFGTYLVLSGVVRAAVELLRVKRDQLVGPITVDLLLALGAAAVGVALWNRKSKAYRGEEA